jgi:hypothetical protein
MTIYTHGTRGYAEATAQLLDPQGVYFGKRIVSRTDHPDLGLEKCLSRLFLEDWSMAVVLDDRDDVWKKEQQSHVICIRPYLFFHQLFPSGLHSGELNNAAGMATIGSDPRSQQPTHLSSPDDNDVGLLKSLATLQTLHLKYFESLDEGNLSPNVGALLLSMRQSVLKGCHLCFSGLIQSNIPNPRNHKLWLIAQNLGAHVTLKMTSQTTHLLTLTVESEKAREAIRLGNVYLCHPDWLLNCHWHILREDETLFLLAPIANTPVIDPLSGGGGVEVEEAKGTESAPTASEGDEQTHKRTRPIIHRSEAGEYGVNYNSNSESDGSNSSDDDEEPKRKFRRFYTLDQQTEEAKGPEEEEVDGDGESSEASIYSGSGASSDVDESWIQSIEEEVGEGDKDEGFD